MDNQIKEACDYFMQSVSIASTSIRHGRVLAEAVFAADPTNKAGDVRNAALEDGAEPDWEELERAHMASLERDDNAAMHATPSPIKAEPTDTDYPEWDNPRVLAVYEILADSETLPPSGIPLDSFNALRIVAKLFPSLPPQGEAQAEQFACEDLPERVIDTLVPEAMKRFTTAAHPEPDWHEFARAVQFEVLARVRPVAAIAPQGRQAKADAVNSKRYLYLKNTTTAIRDHDTGERIECTPEEFEASVDRCIAALQQTQGSGNE